MINNPKLIEKIKRKIKNTTKEQLNQAIREVDEEYCAIYGHDTIISNEYEE